MLCKTIILICLHFFSLSFVIVFAQQPKLVLPVGHTGSINSIKFSPDGKRIATASDDRTVKLWDATTGKLLADLSDHNAGVNSVVFSPDGKLLATAASDATVKLWHVSSGEPYTTLQGNISGFNAAEFSPDGKNIIAVIGDGEITAWNVVSKELIWHSEPDNSYGHAGASSTYFAHYTPGGKQIFSCTRDTTIALWDPHTGKLIRKLPKKPCWDYNRAIASHNGKYIFRWGLKGSYGDIFDLESGQHLYNVDGYSWNMDDAFFSLDDEFLMAPSIGSMGIWNVLTGKLVRTIDGNYETSTYDRNKILLTRKNYEYWITGGISGHTEMQLDLRSEKARYYGATFSRDGKFLALAHSNKTVEIYNTANGKLHTRLSGHTPTIEHMSLSPDGKFLLFSVGGKQLRVWKIEGLDYVKMLLKGNESSQYPEYSPDGKYIIAYDYDGYSQDTINLLKADNGSVIQKFSHTNGIRSFSADSKFLALVTDRYYTVGFWDLEKLIKIGEIPGDGREIKSLEVSPKNDVLLICYGDGSLALIDPVTSSVLHKFKEDEAEGLKARFSPDGKYIMTTHYYGHEAKIWDVKTGGMVYKITDNDEFICDAVFSNDGQKIISLTHHGGDPKIWDVQTGKLILRLTGHSEQARVALFYPGDNQAVTSSDDHTFRIWDVDPGKETKNIDMGAHTDFAGLSFSANRVVALSNPEIKFFNLSSGSKRYTFLAVDSADYMAVTASGYYKSTPDAAKYLYYVTGDLKVISFEQLDVKYNRPDKVLEATGSTDTALIRSYRKAYEKRIKKLGIDTLAFRSGYSVSEADFLNRDAIQYEQKNEKLILRIKGTDSTYKLDRFNVWVNETPVYGQRGLSLRNKNINSFDSTVTIDLSQKENKIETSITNVNGTESYRMPLLVNYSSADSQKTKTHFIGIGIDQFVESKYNLNYSTKDIRDLASKLKEKYKDIIIDTLFNENVTISKVKALKQKLLLTSVNDKVIISYSGHGMLSKDFDYYLSTYAVNFDKPEENGLPYDELESLLDSIPARKKLLLIDACHSGEVDKEDLIAINAASDSLKLKKGLDPVGYKEEGHLGLKNSFELMQSLFVNVGKSTGATIISAAAGTQFALESNDLKNGVFTYSILEAMKNNATMKISELKRIVGERVEQLTNGLQKPTSRNETIAVDWNVW